MKSIVLAEPGRFELGEAQVPPHPGKDEVQVRISQVGICGTDLHAFQGDQPFFTYPRILGHELAVEVIEIGSTEQRHDLFIGDRCCVRPYLNCGICGACQRGFPNACQNIQVLGVHCDGGMRELINVPLDKLHKAPLSNEELALVEMLSIGAHAVRRAQIIPGELALVIGVGPIGAGVSFFARQAGARVITLDINESRLDFARKHLGVEFIINGHYQPLDQIKDVARGDLPTVVLDATGNRASMLKAIDYLAHGGRLVYVGLFQGDVTFHDPEFHKREHTLLASRNATAADFDQVIQAMIDRQVDVTSWITHRASPEQLIRQFSEWLKPESNVLKAILTFEKEK